MYKIINWELADHSQITLINKITDKVVAHFLIDNDYHLKLQEATFICNSLNKTLQASTDQSKLLLADVINPLLTDKQIEEYIWEEISIPLSQVDIDTQSDAYCQYLNAVHWAKFWRDNCNGL